MEFNRLLSSVISTYGDSKFDNDKLKIKYKNDYPKINKKNYHLINNEDEIEKWLKDSEDVGEFSIDTETNSLDPHQAKLVGISISNYVGRACYIPINHNEGKNLNEEKVLKILKPYLEDKSIKKNRTKYQI